MLTQRILSSASSCQTHFSPAIAIRFELSSTETRKEAQVKVSFVVVAVVSARQTGYYGGYTVLVLVADAAIPPTAGMPSSGRNEKPAQLSRREKVVKTS